MIRAILWDVDGTLLDFKAAERAALDAAFRAFGLGPCDDARIARYSVLNDRWWKALERGEVTKAQLLPGRFREFFAAEGLPFDGDYDAFNDFYQIHLGDTVVFRDNAFSLISDLAGQIRQYAVTNGTVTAQRRKLKNSGLDQLLDGVFISEEVGAEKPSPAYFDKVLAALPPFDKDEILIVGDSLTSDMTGGCQAGLRCCWYDPAWKEIPAHLDIEFHIRDLNGVREILRKENEAEP